MIVAFKMWRNITLVTLAVCVAIIIIWKPVWGIDFTGGSLIEVKVVEVEIQELRDWLMNEQNLEANVQTTSEGSLIIRTEPLSPEQHEMVLNGLTEQEWLDEELRFESIGPTIGEELRRKAGWAIGWAILGMIGYLAYVFRSTKELVKPWTFGVAAVVALIHDVLFVTALFVILGQTLGVAIDGLFVTAMLAIVGYSVNDTIVIFQRANEEWRKERADLATTLKKATKKTITRSLNTSFTTLIALVALIVIGGETLRWFAVALAAGTIIGTYSSIFVAPPMLAFLAKSEK